MIVRSCGTQYGVAVVTVYAASLDLLTVDVNDFVADDDMAEAAGNTDIFVVAFDIELVELR